MTLLENLKKYTEYSKGDLSKRCKLEYEDISIAEFDFGEFDLNNSYFGGVTFEKCIFPKVYLSGSNFGGSTFKECIFNGNQLKKACWDDIIVENSNICMNDVFRTSFMFGRFTKSNFNGCIFEKSTFEDSFFTDVNFKGCKFENVNFQNCKFENTLFEQCTFIDVMIDESSKGVRFVN